MKTLFLLTLGTLAFLAPLQSQARTKNLDLILLVDKSLSMENTLEDVKLFINKTIFDHIFIPGDTLSLILFYGKQELVGLKVATESPEFLQLKKSLALVKADGLYTDIGTALDFTHELSEKHFNDPTSRTHFVLLTDGVQESPPGSSYQGPKGTINHRFLDSAKKIERKGWKVQILGIGTETMAEELADDLSGVSTIWDSTQAMLKDSEINFFEFIETTDSPQLVYFEKNKANLIVPVYSEGFSGLKNVDIQDIYLWDDIRKVNYKLNIEPIQLSVFPGNSTLWIPIDPEPFDWISNKTYQISFNFGGNLPITPPRMEIQETKYFLPLYSWALIFLVLFAGLTSLFIWNDHKKKVMDNTVGTSESH